MFPERKAHTFRWVTRQTTLSPWPRRTGPPAPSSPPRPAPPACAQSSGSARCFLSYRQNEPFARDTSQTFKRPIITLRAILNSWAKAQFSGAIWLPLRRLSNQLKRHLGASSCGLRQLLIRKRTGSNQHFLQHSQSDSVMQNLNFQTPAHQFAQLQSQRHYMMDRYIFSNII